ncbi:OLC1v1027676C1 [Oldenlandia corymbosa var. corymbosa]|uniref:OLC1v1027676C1 n=1 Tax=Oldenlandia corymbosa var. corymbosa TaxID=529605 RepID=A0AAV1CAA8_OLDCO|nr:OLC1v1027676C1 [Oldenlandia corymbosa var. corymbosa]
MEEALDMSLDDLIKRNRKPRVDQNANPNAYARNTRGRGGCFRAAVASSDRFTGWQPERPPVRPTPYPLPPLPLRLRLREAPASYGDGSVHNAETKLFVSNLDSGVTDRDIRILFSDVGELKRCAIHCDSTGRSRGTAEVIYAQHADALTAIRRYHNVNLDGKPVKIELIRDTSASSQGVDHCYVGPTFSSNVRDRLGPGRGHASGVNRERRAMVTAEALDSDLEKYNQFG